MIAEVLVDCRRHSNTNKSRPNISFSQIENTFGSNRNLGQKMDEQNEHTHTEMPKWYNYSPAVLQTSVIKISLFVQTRALQRRITNLKPNIGN